MKIKGANERGDEAHERPLLRSLAADTLGGWLLEGFQAVKRSHHRSYGCLALQHAYIKSRDEPERCETVSDR